MKVLHVKDGMYSAGFTLIVNCKANKFDNYLKKRYELFSVEKTATSTKGRLITVTCDDHVDYIIWVENFSWHINEQALLMHELLHYCFAVLDRVGISLVEESEEAYTYYVQRMMEYTWFKLKDLK